MECSRCGPDRAPRVLPNLVYTFGYTNASWTLKADLVAEFTCRLLAAMQKKGAEICVAREPGPELGREPWLDFSSAWKL